MKIFGVTFCVIMNGADSNGKKVYLSGDGESERAGRR